MAIIINSNRVKFVIRALVAAGLCGVDVADLEKVEAFFESNKDLLKTLFDMRIYPNPKADEYRDLLVSMHPYAFLYNLSSQEKMAPVCPIYARGKKVFEKNTRHELAYEGSKYYSIYVADTALTPVIPKGDFVEIKTRENRVSGKLMNMLFVNPDSIIVFDANDCAKTIFTVIEEFKSKYCAYWNFDFDVSLNTDFPNKRKIISRAYTHSSKEFVPSPAIGVIPYTFSKDDFWNLPNMFQDAQYLADIDFTYTYRDIIGKVKSTPSEPKTVHKNMITNITIENGDPIDSVRNYIAYHWFFKELPDATMDIFTNLSDTQVGEEFLGLNLSILKFYVTAIQNLNLATIKKDPELEGTVERNLQSLQQYASEHPEFVYELLSNTDDNYQYLIDNNPVEKLFRDCNNN